MPTVILPNSESVSAEQKTRALKHWVDAANAADAAYAVLVHGIRTAHGHAAAVCSAATL